MTDAPGGPRRTTGFDAIFDPATWIKLEKKITQSLENVFKGIDIKKIDGILIATLDLPGVSKDDVKIQFKQISYGFTRLTVTTRRGLEESVFKSEFPEAVLAEEAIATVELGVLTITVPLKEHDIRSTTDVKIS